MPDPNEHAPAADARPAEAYLADAHRTDPHAADAPTVDARAGTHPTDHAAADGSEPDGAARLPTERLLHALEARRSTELLDGAGEPRDGAPQSLWRENAQLREAMNTRGVIEQAKGVLILRYGVDEDRAFDVLRRWSQDNNIKVHTIADTMVNAVCSDNRETHHDPVLVRWLEEQLRGETPLGPSC